MTNYTKFVKVTDWLTNEMKCFGGTVTFDAYDNDYVRVVVEVEKNAYSDALDPRTLPQLNVRWNQLRVPDDGKNLWRENNLTGRALVLTEKTYDRATERYTLTAKSQLVRLDGWAPAADVTTPTDPTIRTDIKKIADAVLRYAGIGVVTINSPVVPPPSDVTTDGLVWKAGETAGDYLRRVVQPTGYRVIPYNSGSSTVFQVVQSGSSWDFDEDYIPIGEGNGLIAGEIRDSWDTDWCDAVAVVYEQPDGIGRRVDYYKSVTNPTRVKTVTVKGSFPGTGRARNLYNAARRRARVAMLVAVDQPQIMAAGRIRFTIEGRTWNGRVASSTHDLRDGTMRLTVEDLI